MKRKECSSVRVLIADDSILSRKTLKNLLNMFPDLQLAEAANGIEVLEQHRDFKPDLIFMDITMPHMDGVATLRILRCIDRKVKVIVATALGGQKILVKECLALGASAVLTKPLTKDVVVDAFFHAIRPKAGDTV